MPLSPLTFHSLPADGATAYSGERLVNLMARRVQSGVSPIILAGRSGLVEHVTLADLTDQARALTTMGGSLYAVYEGRVWRVTGGVATQVGTIPDGPTGIAAGDRQIALVAGGNYYVCDGASTTQYTPGALTSATDVAFMDGFFIILGSDGNRDDALQLSAVDDGTTFDALQFAFAEYNADAGVALLRDHSRLYVFGTETVQPFYNSGDANFAFLPDTAAIAEHGCGNGQTVAKADSAVFWVRPDGAVVRFDGVNPQIISPAEIKEALADSTITGGFTFSDRGSEIYAITRENDTTWCYDIALQQWHERTAGVNYEPWLAQNSVTLGGVQYFACGNGKIATASERVYTDFGEVLSVEATSAPVENFGKWFSVAHVHLAIRGGESDIDRTPQVMLQTSEDGQAWSYEDWRPLGLIGQHERAADWGGLGSFEGRAQIRVRITDPVPRDIYGVSYE